MKDILHEIVSTSYVAVPKTKRKLKKNILSVKAGRVIMIVCLIGIFFTFTLQNKTEMLKFIFIIILPGLFISGLFLYNGKKNIYKKYPVRFSILDDSLMIGMIFLEESENMVVHETNVIKLSDIKDISVFKKPYYRAVLGIYGAFHVSLKKLDYDKTEEVLITMNRREAYKIKDLINNSIKICIK